jgi:hypothetical protein
MIPEVSRREFLGGSSALAAAALMGGCASVPPPAAGPKPGPPRRLAAVNTVYSLRSHAYHIAGRFIHGYPVNGVLHQPDWQLVRMYNDQFSPSPRPDLSRDLAAKKGFEIARTVAEALGGEKGLDVDAVLLVAEHGTYPNNEFGQILYPRHRLFMEIVAHFKRCGRSVPVFNDKHLSYDHTLAREMVATAREMGFGLMAGSSLPVTWRRPEIEPEIGTPLTEGLCCGYNAGEAYAFHSLETLQVMMERRAAREPGVKSVTALRGPAVWKAGDDGLWSWDLLEAALSRSPSRNYGDPRDNAQNPLAILVEYQDGARGTTLHLDEHVQDFTFAGRVRGQKEPVSALFELPPPPGARYFSALCWNIEKLFATNRSPYPVERTLLTTTVLEFAMRSLAAKGQRMESPDLAVSYAPPADSGFMRGKATDA